MANFKDDKGNEYPKEIMGLFDKFVHGDIDRRGFIEGAGKFAISASSAGAFLNSLLPNFAQAQKISPDDKRLWTEDIKIPSKNGSGIINAYLARPKKLKFLQKLPVIIVVHENRGLNPHIKDIARRIALEGFIAIAPDALTSLGGYPGDEDMARTKFATLDQAKIKQDFIAAANFAKVTEHANNKLGAIGFCYGGGMVNFLATEMPNMKIVIPFYGAPAPIENVSKIKSEIMLHFASDDERFNAMWPKYKEALEANKKQFEAFFYEGTMHGFNNDTTPRYNEKMANLAWQRSIEKFKKVLK